MSELSSLVLTTPVQRALARLAFVSYILSVPQSEWNPNRKNVYMDWYVALLGNRTEILRLVVIPQVERNCEDWSVLY